MKVCSIVLTLGLSGGMFPSCVEEEQNPFETEIADTGDGFEAMLPNPDYGSYRVGDEVIVKGSGFSNTDEICLEYKCLEADEDYDMNGGGIITDYDTGKVKAQIKSVTDSELTFIVPEEMDPSLLSLYEFSTTVYIIHNGKEIRLGMLRTSAISGYFDIYDSKIYIQGDDFPADAQVYMQYFTQGENDAVPTLIGDKVEVEDMTFEGYGITAYFDRGLGNMKIVYEHNGERAICGDADFRSEDFVEIEGLEFRRGQTCVLPWNGYMEGDEVYLANTGRTMYVKTEIVDFEDNKLTILVPGDINTDDLYILILKRYGIEYRMNGRGITVVR